MVYYRCFYCNKDVSEEYTQKRVRCPYCGSKLLFKTRSVTTKIRAR